LGKAGFNVWEKKGEKWRLAVRGGKKEDAFKTHRDTEENLRFMGVGGTEETYGENKREVYFEERLGKRWTLEKKRETRKVPR